MPCGSSYQPGADIAAPHPHGHDGIEDEAWAPPSHATLTNPASSPPRRAHTQPDCAAAPGPASNLTSATTETLRMQGIDGPVLPSPRQHR